MDYYVILGIPRNAAPSAIKDAYRKMARKYHPDVSKEAEAEVRFKEVGEAYKILKNPATRLSYDRSSVSAATGAGAGPTTAPPPGKQPYGTTASSATRDAHDPKVDTRGKRSEEYFGEILDDLMGRAGSLRNRERVINVDGADQYANVTIDLEDTYRGTTCNVSTPTYVDNGYGLPTAGKRTLNVNIPKGIRGGQTLRLAGQGFGGTGTGKAGDLYLELVIRPHRRYRVEERDVYFDVPLAVGDATLGGMVTVAIPDGTLQLTIPPGSAAGRKLRVKGKGIPGEPAGDLYAVIVDWSPPVHTVVAKKAFNALKAAFNFSPK